ncbi:PfkB family carbohydrate kinase [Desulfococcaceae bacterium HSG9]|nr:PfkB family carbohydrate kinase [Desulfococcaceae bacterium HSG9]
MDILCVGHACYDLTFAVDHPIGTDEKAVASDLISCGGGPAANAAVTASMLGSKTALAAYLGNDTFGESHFNELVEAGVITRWVIRSSAPTPLSTIWAQPDGQRALVNYKGTTPEPHPDNFDFSKDRPSVILFDGLLPEVSFKLAQWAREKHITTILDAGSVHKGTTGLIHKIDYLVASEEFAHDYTSSSDADRAVSKLSRHTPNVVVTLGDRGLIWQNGHGRGRMPAFQIKAIDTTGAGDAFHGAFARGISLKMPWNRILQYASAVGALCCTKMGARKGIPTASETERFLRSCISENGVFCD